MQIEFKAWRREPSYNGQLAAIQRDFSLHSKYNSRVGLEAHSGRMTMTAASKGAYGAADDIVDYILGITFEIWEQRGIDLIDEYYGPDTVVYSLDGIVRGSTAMIDGTNAMLSAFPDRLLLGDDVIVAGDSHAGYSSHRVLSPMTNTGDSMFGAATGKAVRIMNIADCVVEEGVITLEWLARDNLALVQQLGFDVRESALLVKNGHTSELRQWFEEEAQRLAGSAATASAGSLPNAGTDPAAFSQRLTEALWQDGDAAVIESAYAPYAVMHRSPIEIVSGRPAISDCYAQLRRSFSISGVSVDHVITQPAGDNAISVATRWAACGRHTGTFLDAAPTDKPVYIMGVTHRRIVDGRIAVEWTVFDRLGVLSQIL
jgi:predicted ester cyclase